MLIHQIPPKPNYFRVKIWRRLQRLGAVGIKNSVYALPSTEQAQEDLNWVLREIVEGGGDASLVEARLVEGLNDEQVREMFRAARDIDYLAVARDTRALAKRLPRKGAFAGGKRGEREAALARLQKRVGEIAALDFFHARGRESLEGLLREVEQKLAARAPKARAPRARAVEKPRGATWVTRTGIHVDRMASAWLIRRFIDIDAEFIFIEDPDEVPADATPFDIRGAEFSHHGGACTFERMIEHYRLDDAALQDIARIVHEADLSDDRFDAPEAAGLDVLVRGLSLVCSDREMLDVCRPLFDGLYEYRRRASLLGSDPS